MTTRRNFLKAGLTTAIAGTAVNGGFNFIRPDTVQASTWEHPYGWPYNGLNVEGIRELGYQGYKGITLEDNVTHKHCSFATFHAIISQLAEAVGHPYDSIPTQMMEWASGGVAGFASFCGALNGACAAIGIICSNGDAKKFISDLLTWYAETPLPTNKISSETNLPQSIAKGNLCHMSVTRWCLKSGFASGSPERSERCARLAGDVAAKVVEMLNNGAEGSAVPGDKTTCRSCHYKGEDFDKGQFTRGKMDCTSCHVDLEKVDHDHWEDEENEQVEKERKKKRKKKKKDD